MNIVDLLPSIYDVVILYILVVIAMDASGYWDISHKLWSRPLIIIASIGTVDMIFNTTPVIKVTESVTI